MKRYLLLGSMALLAALLSLTFAPSSAAAHSVRLVGKYMFVVGFLNEPAFINQQNSIDLTICNGTCEYTPENTLKNGVVDLEKTLKAEVSMEKATPLALPLETRWKQPGKYSSYFVPSQSGNYTFHITGTINGTQVDEKFTSGPGSFSEPEALKIYPAQNTTNTAALQSRQIQEVQDAVSRATTFGIVGSVLGIAGLALAGFALTRRPKASTQTPTEVPTKPVNSLRS